MSVRVEVLKSFRALPVGTLMAFAEGPELEALELGGLIVRVTEALPIPEPEQVASARVILCADKVFMSPARYPSDIFGARPDEAVRLIETKAAHVATDEDLRAFYDPRRGLKPSTARR